jgi:hypothetical protein
MLRPRLILLSLLLVAGTTWTPSAFAQNRYSPVRGPISPWMDIFQRKPGPLDNYHSYVRPELQLQRTLNLQDNALAQNANGIQVLGQRVENGQREIQVRPTGTNSVYMEYSHYYPMRGGNVAARSRPASRGMTPSSGTRYLAR